MTVRRNKLGRAALAIGLSATMLSAPAFAENAAPLDPYAVAAPAPPPPPLPPSQGGITNQNTANPTNTVNANPTNTNNNDNRSAATVTNNNTIYIYPPSLPPPPPPVIGPPTIAAPLPAPTAISPPPLVPPPPVPPTYGRYGYPPPPVLAPRPQRIRLTLPPPRPLAPIQPPERIRYVALGASFTSFGMANQPFAGWGTLYGGGVQLNFRSRGHFGFELSQDFLRGELRATDGGPSFVRNSYPFQFTFKGYILPNSDRHHFNMYFGAGLGAMSTSIDIPLGSSTAEQHFLEWMIHADVGAELRFNWFALGADARITGLARDRNYGDGAYYGDIQNAPVPAGTWGVQGRAFVNFWF